MAKGRPDILERMKAGEFRSVRAAAIAAGIVKVPTRLQQLQRVWKKLSAKEREDFFEWVNDEGA